MKKISLFLLATGLITMQSCKDFVSKDDVSPNTPTHATLATLTPVCELSIFSVYTGQMARSASIFVQHTEGTDGQMVDFARYQIGESDITNDWNTIYSSGVVNTKQLIADATAQKSPYYAGIGKVLQAMLYGAATDYWGDVPTTEAGLGLGNLTPKYERQEVVLQQIQALLTDAISDFKTSEDDNAKLPGLEDFMHKGDPAAWKKAAWLLKARYANRLSERNATSSANDVLAYLDSAEAITATYETNAIFDNSQGSSLNSWYAFDDNRYGYISVSATLVDTLKGLSDPRLPYYVNKDDDGNYTGAVVGAAVPVVTSLVGDFYKGNKLPLITKEEALFMKAEAALRKNDDVTAQAAYADAIATALSRFNISDATYLANNGTLSGTNADKMAQIMFQKWIAMYTQPEVWADWRRTGLPVLTPSPAASKPIPRRYPTTVDERVYNPYATVISNTTDHVWWDAQ